MKKNCLLVVADVICITGIILGLLSAAGLIISYLVIRFHPGSLNSFIVDGEYLRWSSLTSGAVLRLNQLTPVSAGFLCLLKMSALLIFSIILYQIRNFVRSIRSYSAFHAGNVSVFRTIAICFLILGAIDLLPVPVSTLLTPGGNAGHISVFWSFNGTYFAAFVFALIMAEVFREGSRLKEEDELTI